MASSIRGLDSLVRKIEALGGNSKRALKVGIHQAAKAVQGDAKLLAPVADIDGGTLRNSIKGETTVKNDKVVGKVFTNLYYAPYVEFGTGQRGEASPSPPKADIALSYRQDWKGMVAQPYLYPALKQNEARIKAIIKDKLQREIRRLGGQ